MYCTYIYSLIDLKNILIVPYSKTLTTIYFYNCFKTTNITLVCDIYLRRYCTSIEYVVFTWCLSSVAINLCFIYARNASAPLKHNIAQCVMASDSLRSWIVSWIIRDAAWKCANYFTDKMLNFFILILLLRNMSLYLIFWTSFFQEDNK